MKEITIKAPAKINLTLEVLNKRPDGFHNIQSIMQTISLYDFLQFKISENVDNTIELNGNSSEIPYNEKNLVCKACIIFLKETGIKNVKISVNIEKNIPVSAGLAGGSTNAAAALFALNKLFDYPLNDIQINNLCAQLGSDLNFCLKGGCGLCTSRGEIIQSLPSFIQKVSLIKPKKLGISAKEAYTKFSQLQDKTTPDNTNKLRVLLEKNQFDKNLLYNSLEKALFPAYEELRKIKNGVKNSLMSGSGSTFFVLSDKIEIENGFLFNEKEYEIFENLKTVSTGVSEV